MVISIDPHGAASPQPGWLQQKRRPPPGIYQCWKVTQYSTATTTATTTTTTTTSTTTTTTTTTSDSDSDVFICHMQQVQWNSYSPFAPQRQGIKSNNLQNKRAGIYIQ